MKKNSYIAPSLIIVQMDTEDSILQMITTSITTSDKEEDDVTEVEDILSTGEGIGWQSSIWDD
ncbi:MAG: hypothetical protein NC388_05760 [Clostridium sp.]|nr:hypothetical protein [Clostridium sp.]